MSDKKVPSYLDVIISNYDELQSLKVEIERLRAEMQQVRLDHITTLAELQEAAAEIEWLKEALTDAQNETRRG